MVRERIAAWRRRLLLDRIALAHNKANGVRHPRSWEPLKRTVMLASIAGFGGVAVAQDRPGMAQAPSTESCMIKGNISDYGERIYHVPGGAFYGKTRISPAKGERWFCTEAEARAAGWRRSRR